MADFVNYNKRSIDLPPGCKDLIDVLRGRAPGQEEASRTIPSRAFTSEQLSSFKIERDEKVSGPLSALGERVLSLYQCGEGGAVLLIETPDSRLSVGLLKRENITAWVNFQPSLRYGQIVRDFLSERGMNPSSLPVEIMRTLSPLPAEPAEVSRLLLDLFHALGLKDDTLMSFRLVQWSKG